MSREQAERLRDIHDAIRSITDYAALWGRSSAVREPLIRDGILHNLVVIGEAVKALSDETRARAPEIPWDDIAGLGDLIAHEYFRVQMKIIDDTVERDLPPLRQAVERLLTELG